MLLCMMYCMYVSSRDGMISDFYYTMAKRVNDNDFNTKNAGLFSAQHLVKNG